MKDLQYITHDMGARNDPKLLDLQMEMGGKGLGIFWCLVEMLWENDGRMPLNTKAIAFSLRWCKPTEVDKVIRQFGLFENDGQDFWSNSALERIAQKKQSIREASDRGRKAIESRWNRARSAESNSPEIHNQYGGNTPVLPRNKDINIERYKESINNIPPTADFLFEIFFFRNLKEPSAEVNRFMKYYNEHGWTYQDGTPITDAEQAARDWKPTKAGTHYPEEALNWYKAVYNSARDRVKDSYDVFLARLADIRMKDNKQIGRAHV